MQCEMCGSVIDSGLFKTKIEGSVINVCNKCSRYGVVVAQVKSVPILSRDKKEKSEKKTDHVSQETETIFVIAPNYATKIKSGRERLGLKQEELAKKLNERDSLLSKIESGAIEPSIKLAEKLERFFNIKLIEEHKEDGKLVIQGKATGATIGDLAKIKKRELN
jgi:putative transcription factor